MELKVTCIRSDQGIEFDNAKFDEFCNENGITHNFSSPRTPQQNDVVEKKKNRTLEDMAQTMLIDNGIAKKFLGRSNKHCLLLGEQVYDQDQLGKFDTKSDEGIFLGYSSQSKAYKVYNKRTQCVEESVHVLFNETPSSNKGRNSDDQDNEPLLVPGEISYISNGKAALMSQMKETGEDNATSSSTSQEEPGTSITTTKVEERVGDAVQGTLQTRPKAKNSLVFSIFMSHIEPKNIKEALKDADWITAMQEELHQFERNKVIWWSRRAHLE
ncbi:uncharacterized protein LOC142177505 [Nicotiana tabacum]|uniref:Uncharacterized protein LOC142177505 n=1 Tax=Nicotiana tabacum TaxID=4097 RepID=A0AC58TZC2_TOBAC